MASENGNTYNALQVLLSSLMWKDEILQIGLFRQGENIEKHVSNVEQKIDELKILPDKQAEFIKKTLHQDILYELATITDFSSNKTSFEWIKKTLLDLFASKESKVSSIAYLLKIQQQPGQNLREFLSQVRIECQKHCYNKSTSEKEQLMLMTFINGLHNSAFSKILKELKPATIEEAYSLIKNEKVDEYRQMSYVNALQLPPPNDRCSCSNQIQLLLSKVKELEAKIVRLSQQKQSEKGQKRFSEIKCFNCNLFGHIARNCRKPPICKNCGKQGHISENCRRRRQSNLRNMSNENGSIISEPSTTQILDEHCDFEATFNEPTDKEKSGPAINTIVKAPALPIKVKKRYSKDINSWAQYIDGHGDRPKRHLKKYGCKSEITSKYTRISLSNSEPAKNKPVVKGTIAGEERNFLLDSGAETNVLDKELFKRLKEKNGTVKFIPQSSSLKCANGSLLEVIGYTVLRVQIGGVAENVKFTVVGEIFPKVILGMNCMRKMGVILDASKGHAMLGGQAERRVVVPFISRSSENF